MTKAKARKLLNEYLQNNEIPIMDVVIDHSTSSWTFIGLIKFLYDL